MDYPKTGIILVNYEDYAERFLADCRQSLLEQTYPKDRFKVYIVDNASSPKSVNFLQQVYPQAKVLTREDGNYSAANNLGAREAINDGCEYLVIANMDTKFDRNWLKELVKIALKKENIGMVQSKILLWNKDKKKRARINTLGNDIHFLAFGLVSYYNKPDMYVQGSPEIQGYASGCSLLIKKEVFKKIGGYIEDFYMYHDDLELGWKTRLVGYKIVLAPKSVVYHKYEFSRSIKMLYYMERNRMLTLFLLYRWNTLLLILPILILTELGLVAMAFFSGWGLVKIRAYLYFLNPKNIKRICQLRKQVQSLRHQKEKIIISGFQSKLSFGQKPSLVLQIVNPLLHLYWRLVKIII